MEWEVLGNEKYAMRGSFKVTSSKTEDSLMIVFNRNFISYKSFKVQWSSFS